jgi:small subunit ribosomal protein S17
MSKKFLNGLVTNKNNHSTISVTVKRSTLSNTYKKIIVKSKKYFVHDKSNKFVIGDKIIIVKSKPVSKSKHWIVAIN